MPDLVLLGDFISTQKGYAFKSKWYSEVGHPIVKVSDFTSDSIDSTKLILIPNDIASEYSRYMLHTNDVIVQTVGSWPSNPASVVGKTVKVPKNTHGALLNQNAVKIIPNDKIDNAFLYYLLRSDQFKDYIVGTAQGAASQASITLDSIKTFKFDLPLMVTQQKIASILSTYDDLIENNNRRIAILEEMAQKLYREWFVKFRFPGHEDVKMVDSELGEIPEGWVAKKLSDAIKINRGRSYRSIDLVDEEGLPFLNLKNVARNGGFRRDGLKRYSGAFKESQTAKANDIIMAVTDMTQERAIIARPARVPDMGIETFVLSMDLVKIEVNEGYDESFIYGLLKYSQFSNIVKQYANGANVLHLKPQLISDYVAIIPTVEIMQQFSQILKPITELTDKLEKKNDYLKESRNLLLPKLISGKIEV